MTTQNVTVTLVDASLDPVVGARVNAKLFFPESLTDFIAPESSEVTGTTDAAGQAVLAVWPNSLNTTVQTYYRFRAWHPTNKDKKILDVCAYVSADANLEDISYDCRGATSGITGTSESAALAAHIADPTDAHDASAISVLDTAGNFTATDVEAALAELAGSDLQYFVEARSVAAPNDTVPVHSFTATGAETHIDAVFSPKGNGAIAADIADSLSSGGNKRGINAVDLQAARFAASTVASGDYSVVSGGRGNTASAAYSVCAGGLTNSATGVESACGGGISNVASGSYSVASGGHGNIASGERSVVPGGYLATTRGLYGRYSFASGSFDGSTGRAQFGRNVLRYATTGATAAIITSDGLAASATNVSVLPDNYSYSVSAKIVARDTSTGDTKVWTIEGAVKRGANAAATALVGTPTKTVIGADAATTTWDVALIADTTLGAAEIQVTGEAAKTIYWACKFDTVEVG